MPKKKNTTRKDGRIKSKVYLGLDESGKRKYKYVYGRTQPEVDEKVLQLKISMRKGIDVTAERDTFGEWADRWIKVKALEVSRARKVAYESHIKHLKKNLEYSAITKMRPADLQDIVTALSIKNPNTGKPMARETLSGLKSTAIQIFQLAIDNRVIDYNPANAVRLPNTPPPSPRRALTDNEQGWITDTPHRARRAAMIMMYAGLRRGEVIPLLWSDIDLKEKTIRVNKAIEFVGGKPILKDTTKTPAGIRSVDIPQKLVDFLSTEPHESIYVCVTAKDKMHTESSWRRLWESYLADLNIKHGDFSPFEKKYESKFDPKGVPFVIPLITPHWLRHTFCTMLYMAGVDAVTAMAQMGHSDIKTTLETYTHLDALHKRKSMNKLDVFLGDGGQMGVSG